MGLTIAASQQALDAVFPTSAATDYIAYSEDGTSETTILARTAIGATGWAAATHRAQRGRPSPPPQWSSMITRAAVSMRPASAHRRSASPCR